jgi:hypothetical protein
MQPDPAAAFAAAIGPDWRGLVAARLGLPRQSAQRWGKPRWPPAVLDTIDALLEERRWAAVQARAKVARLREA